MSNRPAPAAARPSELAALIEHESALEERLVAARVEAETLIDEARQRAADDEAALAAELEAGRAAIADEIAAGTRARIDEITSRAAAETARYRALTGAELDRLADELAELLARQLTGGGS